MARPDPDHPAGQVTLRGAFFEAHREEVLALVAASAERALGKQPPQRIVGIEHTAEGVVVTTTDAALARGIGVALQAAYQGDLDLWFSRDDGSVRALWAR